MPNYDAFILIGGQSSRLGIDKAFVTIGERTFLRRATDTIRDALPHAKITAVAGSEIQFATQALTAGVPFIFDLHQGRGPLGGLHAALAYASTTWIFVLACDYPFVPSDMIRRLVERVSDDYGAIVPEQSDGRLQPLAAFYNVRNTRPIVEGILELQRPAPPMMEVVDQLDPLIVRFDEYMHLPGAKEFFMNINTVEDLEKARDRV